MMPEAPNRISKLPFHRERTSEVAPARFVGEIVALAYLCAIAGAAKTTGFALLLFPELAALSHNVFTRPRGRWAGQPLRLVLTPTLTAIAGTALTRILPYNVGTILLIVCVSVLIIQLLRSVITPAISAGVLPAVLGVQSWLYPLGILCGLSLLAIMLLVWQRRFTSARASAEGASCEQEDQEAHGRIWTWLPGLLLFVVATGIPAQLTGLRFVLFPPLIVMAYEMFGHPGECPWKGRPLAFPAACFVAALGGLYAVQFLGTGVIGVAAAVAWGIITLRVFRVEMPPALAVGLIPFVMNGPSFKYVISVGVGTLALSVGDLAWQRWRTGGRLPKYPTVGEIGRESSDG